MSKLLLILSLFFIISAESQAQDVELSIGIKLFEDVEYSEAKAIFEPFFKENSQNDQAAYYLGRIYHIEKDYDKSIEYLEIAADLNNNQSEYHFWLGVLYGTVAQESSIFKQVGYAKKIKRAFEKTIELDPSNVNARINLSQYYIQAPGFMGGSLEKAHEQAKEIKKMNLAQGCQIFADIHVWEKNFDLAENEFLTTIKENPNNTDLYYFLANLYERTEKYHESVITYEKVLTMDSVRLSAYYSIGRIGALYNTDLEKAVLYLKKYLESTPTGNLPSLSWAHYRLGMVYENMSDKGMAKTEYEAALSLDPEHEEAKAALSDL